LAKCASLARADALSARDLHGCFKPKRGLSKSDLRYELSMYTRPNYYEGEASQSRQYLPPTQDTAEEERARRSFGDMPVIVLTAGIVDSNPGWTPAVYQTFVQRWTAAHEALAARSREGKHVLVTDAHHFIQLDRPGVVIDAVVEVVRKTRGKRAQ
jgi:hypothetical protein